MEIQDVVPHYVVFLTPGAGLVEGEFVMVILACHAIPLCRKGFCEHHVSLCKCIITSTCCNLRESAEGFNRLYRKIGVVCKVSGEVVGTQLIFWVETLLFKVSCPLAKLRHI